MTAYILLSCAVFVGRSCQRVWEGDSFSVVVAYSLHSHVVWQGHDHQKVKVVYILLMEASFDRCVASLLVDCSHVLEVSCGHHLQSGAEVWCFLLVG